ncbi:HAD hydrolase-like protein [Salinicoccus cyprini]|nr:HAD hydrolase-like protein [Salinicoccus cyprini]
MNKAVVFDMDGTLLRTELILESSLTKTLKELDTRSILYVENPVEKYKEIMGVTLEEVWRNLLISPKEDTIRLANDIFQGQLISCINTGSSKLYDGATETLASIKSKGYRIFVASNGDQSYLDAIFNHHNLARFITSVHSINGVQSLDKSDLVEYIIESENVDAKYMVGDRLSDIKAGRENNLQVIGCNFYFAKDEELEKADYVIDSLKELVQIII